MAKHNEVGIIGEKTAQKYLLGIGHEILDTNVRYPYGEIDIVTRERIRSRFVYHFVEVKSVARERSPRSYDPLQNISREKLARQRRAVQAYLMRHREVHEWQYDVLCVYIPAGRQAECEYLPNQVL